MEINSRKCNILSFFWLRELCLFLLLKNTMEQTSPLMRLVQGDHITFFKVVPAAGAYRPRFSKVHMYTPNFKHMNSLTDVSRITHVLKYLTELGSKAFKQVLKSIPIQKSNSQILKSHWLIWDLSTGLKSSICLSPLLHLALTLAPDFSRGWGSSVPLCSAQLLAGLSLYL